MRRVAEIIYVVPERREAFLEGALKLDDETANVLWMCGVRKQQYFSLNELIFMTFEYDGHNFDDDMKKMAIYLDSKGMLIKKRRKDVPVEERDTTDWWAPVKRLGTVLDSKPVEEEEMDYSLMEHLDGSMSNEASYSNTSYDEDDWSDGFHFSLMMLSG